MLLAALGSGFVFLCSELVWYRLSAPLLGGSTYSFGMVLAVALAGVGVGSALYASWPVATSARLSFTFALTGALLLLPFALGDDLALLAFSLRQWGAFDFLHLVISWSLVMSVVVLPAAVVFGFQFPLLVALYGQKEMK
jgi:predicted membrane-bound spermidine synthase